VESSLAALLHPGWTQAALLGAWFGVLHAFDADHLATIGGLAVGHRAMSPAAYALRWACGHAASLALVAAAALGLGASGLVEWAAHADLLVCGALLVIGANALRGVRPRAAAGRAERHAVAEHVRNASAPHLHFLAPLHAHRRSGRAGTLLGMLHGGAGSAAVLGLLPLAHFGGALESALYLSFFSLGVAGGAIAFAALFGALARRTLAAGERVGAAFQCTVGVVAIASAAWLLFEIAHGRG
jgi:hypothetical protein